MLSEVLWEFAESGDGEVVTEPVSFIFGNEAELGPDSHARDSILAYGLGHRDGLRIGSVYFWFDICA